MKEALAKWTLSSIAGIAVLFGAQRADATLIGTYAHTYGSVDITLNVFDGQPGGRYLWEYTVDNGGYGGGAGQNGFSGFELFLPTPIPEIADILPGAPWEHNCCSGNPVEWDIRNSAGDGVLPGSSGVFSFTTDPRAVAINDDGWYHTWVADVQADIVPTPGMHVPWVPGLTRIPDGGNSLLLFGFGFASLLLVWSKRRVNNSRLAQAKT